MDWGGKARKRKLRTYSSCKNGTLRAWFAVRGILSSCLCCFVDDAKVEYGACNLLAGVADSVVTSITFRS